jgi:DNA-directed RNA polymerase II subunit RPB1
MQFLYGEDGIEGTKIENQYLPYIGMSQIEMDAKYHLRPEDPLHLYLTPEAFKQMAHGNGSTAKGKDIFARCTKHFEEIVDDRQYLITKVFKGERIEKIQYPIPFDRIIKTAIQRLHLITQGVTQTDLTPVYILDAIDALIEKLKIMRSNQGIRFLHVLLRVRLSPKILIFDIHMTQEIFNWVTSEIERYFVNAVAQAGEMVGIVAAQSIGELGTQATLDSFHSSGTAAAVKATSGVPRLKELLNVSKNIKTPTLLVYMKPDISAVIAPMENDDGTIADPRVQEAKEKSMKIMQQLEITRLCDILDGTDIYWDPPGEDGLDTGIQDDDGMLAVYRAFQRVNSCRSDSPWVLRLRVNKDKLYRVGMTMMDVYLRIYNAYRQTIECVFSDDNAPELIFRVRMSQDAVRDISGDDAISALKAMEHNILNNILLKGVKGIKKVSMRIKKRNVYNNDQDLFEKIAEWVLDTDGTNLQKILSNPNVDAVRTRSNDIYEVFQVLGIEAARNALFQEFMEVVGEGAINYRHMSLLLDTMTNRGALMSVDRHGINRGDVGPLAKSSFEETTDMLINASIFSEHDRINGVSANIMLGQLPPCGTCDHDILLNEELYTKYMMDAGNYDKNKSSNIVDDDNYDVDQVFQEGCSIDTITFKYNMKSNMDTCGKNNSSTAQKPRHNVTFV